METCLDCHEVLKKEKKAETSTTSTTRTQPPVVSGGDQSSCKHERVTWRGSNGFQWKRTCLDCGHKTSGYHSEKRPQQQRHGGSSTSSTTTARVGGLRVDQMQDVFRICSVVANVKAMENGQQVLEPGDLHRILDAAMTSMVTTPLTSGVTGQPVASTAMPPQAPRSGGARRPHPKNGKRITFGPYKNYCYEVVYYEYPDYVENVLEHLKPSSCKGMHEFAAYCREKKGNQVGEGYMALDSENPTETLLDLGCNKTCHGDQWLKRYQVASGVDDVPLEPDHGNGFRGIGGKIGTAGVRHLQVSFELEDGNMAVGDLKSVELEDSDAPLLLSIDDQRKLGLQVTLEFEILLERGRLQWTSWHSTFAI